MSRFQNGWIKFYRSAIEGDIGDNAYLLAVWITLLSWATRCEQKKHINGTQRILPPGSVVFSFTELADKWGCSKDTVQRYVRYLESTGRLSVEVRTKGCIATICNWAEYQEVESECRTNVGQTSDADRTPIGRGSDYNGEDKKERSNTRRSRVDYEPAFEEVYKTYPRQEGKSRGYKIWLKLSQEEKEQLKTAVANYSKAKAGKDAEYLKHFSTFMGEWSDWVNPSTGKPTNPPTKPRKLKTAEEIEQGALGV